MTSGLSITGGSDGTVFLHVVGGMWTTWTAPNTTGAAPPVPLTWTGDAANPYSNVAGGCLPIAWTVSPYLPSAPPGIAAWEELSDEAPAPEPAPLPPHHRAIALKGLPKA